MKKIYFSLFLILGLLSCQSNSNKNVPKETKTTVTNNNAKSVKAETIYISDETNTNVAQIDIADKTVIYYGEKHIYAKIGSSGKRKYITDNDEFIAKISIKENGFKLKTEEGNLQWKVKINESKVKIADNEEMQDSYEIKYKQEDLLVVTKNGEKEGKALYTGSWSKVENTEETFFLVPGNSYTAGVLAVKEIPLELRLVIMAELALLGK